MGNQSLLLFIMVAFIVFIILKIFYESDAYNLKCILSNVDGQTYCVRDRKHLQPAADLLAKVTVKCKELVDYVGKKYTNNEDVKRLVENFNPKKISETLPTSEYTAYSENKGEKLAFCLDKRKNEPQLIDINTLTFVAIHELSHIMTKSEGHLQEFWKNFKFLLQNAKDAGIYKPVDYKKKSQSYCGMDITDNPYYDFK